MDAFDTWLTDILERCFPLGPGEREGTMREVEHFIMGKTKKGASKSVFSVKRTRIEVRIEVIEAELKLMREQEQWLVQAEARLREASASNTTRREL